MTQTTTTGYEIGAEAIYLPTGVRVILTGWSGSNNRWDIEPADPADRAPWFATTDELQPVVEPADTRNIAAGNVIVRLTETRGVYRITVEYASTCPSLRPSRSCSPGSAAPSTAAPP
jgi:hypothetical protein